MRLICPNCDAQYEVDASAIPEAGRDVQCSNCGHAWFQLREAEAEDLNDALYQEPVPDETAPVPDALAQTDPDDEEEAAPPPPPVAAAPVQRSLDESVLAVLREEAERETAARRAESAGLEMQGDLGLPPPVQAAVGSAAAMTDTERRVASLKGQPVPPQRAGARRDLLPDIEEINSSLRPTETASSLDSGKTAEPAASSSGFRSGFALMLVVVVLGLALYVMAPQISAQIPGAADAMAAYVAAVDAGRAAMDGLMQRATEVLKGLTGG